MNNTSVSAHRIGSCHKCMNKILNTKIRRGFLLLVCAFPITLFPPIKDVFDYIYFPVVSGCAGFILFWNFPFFVYMTASRPLYYEDLFIDEARLPNYNISPLIKEKFQCILLWVLIFTNSLLCAALSDYWLYKTTGQNGALQIIGITGGIIKIFQIVNNTIGRLMLKIIKIKIVGESIRYEERQRQSIENIMQLKHTDDTSKSIELTERNKIICHNNPLSL